MSVATSNGTIRPAIISEAAAWLIEFRAGDVNGDASMQFIDWLRRSPEHVRAYLEISRVWAKLPNSDPEHKIDITALIERARREPYIIKRPSWRD
jgi:transmembrane sensor